MPGSGSDDSEGRVHNVWDSRGLRKARRKAGREGEPLTEEDWELIWELHETRGGRLVHAIFSALPGDARCRVCNAPFDRAGGSVARPLGYRPSRKNPLVCSMCVENSPPGGLTMEIGVLFADIRGFTASSEGATPQEVSATLNRFYGAAERVLLPVALIDKLIGDEVMALYLPVLRSRFDQDGLAATMLAHARGLLAEVGYGTPEGPSIEVGVGLDFGEAFVGNIGERAVFDFTAVGDVVNTASRLQGEATGGEIVLSERLGTMLGAEVGDTEEIVLKGKADAQRVHRLRAS